MIAVTVQGRIPVVFEFPYGSSAMNAADWTHPEKHTTRQQAATPNRLDLERRLDADTYTRQHLLARDPSRDQSRNPLTASS